MGKSRDGEGEGAFSDALVTGLGDNVKECVSQSQDSRRGTWEYFPLCSAGERTGWEETRDLVFTAPV